MPFAFIIGKSECQIQASSYVLFSIGVEIAA